ncbi:hypothetical protein Vafri_18021, partial [Volvox africanus]
AAPGLTSGSEGSRNSWQLSLLFAAIAATAATATILGARARTRRHRSVGLAANERRWWGRQPPAVIARVRGGAAGANDVSNSQSSVSQLMLWMLDEMGDMAVETQLDELGFDLEPERQLPALLRERVLDGRRLPSDTGQKQHGSPGVDAVGV